MNIQNQKMLIYVRNQQRAIMMTNQTWFGDTYLGLHSHIEFANNLSQISLLSSAKSIIYVQSVGGTPSTPLSLSQQINPRL